MSTSFSLEGASLEFSEAALAKVAQIAMERGTGARALRAVIDAFMLNLMYDLPDGERSGHACLINEQAIDGECTLEDLEIPHEARESA